MSTAETTLDLAFHPLTPERWADLEELFGARGACGGCWCMWWRLPRSQYTEQKGEGNRRALRALVDSGRVPGILAYADGRPVGWCAVEPREAYPALERSRNLRRVDDEPVWSVTCFFVARGWRRRGVTARLLRAAVEHVRARGGRVVEGYPVEPRRDGVPGAFAWTGFASAFRRAGFVEAARRSDSRPVMRCVIEPRDRPPGTT
ncbi:MAG TPA: GNAT family N-acetyltransferase [Longimicrobium sp.]|jgi:GNAT superfamily N-acetyltransferase